jgi:hypothetical protein
VQPWHKLRVGNYQSEHAKQQVHVLELQGTSTLSRGLCASAYGLSASSCAGQIGL